MSNQEQAALANTSTDEPPQGNHVAVDIENVDGDASHDPVIEETPQDRTIPKYGSPPLPGNKKDNKGAPFFGITPYQSPYQSPYTGTRTYNYTEKYAPDPLGEEFKENARVWKVYLDEAKNYDDKMLRGFKDTIDSLLIFAALFSAVVTTFVVATVDSLQPDYSQITATLLSEQVKLLRAAGNVTKIKAIPPSSVDLNNVIPSKNDLWINGLFFASLSLSLATALLSVLVKQWLQAYSSISSGNAKERAVIRQFRFSGLEKWKVPEIIGILPLILHASLALFFVGPA
ncbi:hypothetical protein GYMLUDRAFT_244704 [Collybiopsis luxurians FD-317 M1]|uniref:DUF6535 domain-containing protein n=1 Tax=Collybiopsis luxurians FD-317 M1 TaxID=944289 RepID=A0A0D0CMQ3_9AGAR|nr:hypothetical protein GYMLUDRAFT_244704 [Collybiopsis luxurians FD-317 M1]